MKIVPVQIDKVPDGAKHQPVCNVAERSANRQAQAERMDGGSEGSDSDRSRSSRKDRYALDGPPEDENPGLAVMLIQEKENEIAEIAFEDDAATKAARVDSGLKASVHKL